MEELDPISKRIIDLAAKSEKGISQKDIQREIPELQSQKSVEIINHLLKNGYIALFQQGGNLLYKFKGGFTSSSTIRFSSNEEKLVYSVIEKAGNKGIWVHLIKRNTGLSPTELAKILKDFKSKKHIKEVKSVTESRKKVYMLYNLMPDESVTGGVWYDADAGDFDEEFIDVMQKFAHKFLIERRDKVSSELNVYETFASSTEILNYLTNLKISKKKLQVDDIENLMNTLVWDDKAEKKIISGKNCYRATKPLLNPTPLLTSPCGTCPVMKNCSDNGDINPIKCNYISEWMDESKEFNQSKEIGFRV